MTRPRRSGRWPKSRYKKGPKNGIAQVIKSQKMVPKNECFSSKIIAVTTSWPITGKKTITRNNIEFIKQPLLPDMVDSSPLSCIVISKSLSDSHHERSLVLVGVVENARSAFSTTPTTRLRGE